MINLHTGVPGAGKTLYTLWLIRQAAASDNRPVFYNGITLLRPEEFPNWQELPRGEDWHTCPAGSIVVLDECQRVFRPRGNGAVVPKHVEALETHRHSGVDLYVITQHPMLVDSNLRRLVGVHRHVVRPFGVPFATVHEFEGVREQCDKSRTGSVERRFAYPRDMFGAYKSAEVHTHKSRIPARVFVLLALPVLLAACVYWAYSWWAPRLSAEQPAAAIQAAGTAQGGEAAPRAGGARKTVSEWVAEQQPRVAGLAYSAPIYDRITEPTDAPYPAACLVMPDRGCRCYSQQATVLDVPQDLCRQIVDRGFFVAWKRQGQERNDRAGGGRAATPAGPSRDETEQGDGPQAVGSGGRAWGGIPATASWGGVR